MSAQAGQASAGAVASRGHATATPEEARRKAEGMGPWVGGSLGQLYGGVSRRTSPKGRVQTCQLVVAMGESAGPTRSGLSLMFISPRYIN